MVQFVYLKLKIPPLAPILGESFAANITKTMPIKNQFCFIYLRSTITDRTFFYDIKNNFFKTSTK